MAAPSEFVAELRQLAAALTGDARDAATCARAAAALEEAAARIASLEHESSLAFRKGMEAEAYLANTPAEEDG